MSCSTSFLVQTTRCKLQCHAIARQPPTLAPQGLCHTVNSSLAAWPRSHWTQQTGQWSQERRALSNPGLCNSLGLLAEADTLDGLLPTLVAPALGAAVGVLGLRFYLYSQLEYATAAMLTNHVPRGVQATVMQLGGEPKQLYYYPKDTSLVVNVGPNVKKSLMEQAGMTAAVPTVARQQPFADLQFQPTSSVDAVVSLGSLSSSSSSEQQACLAQAWRVLKPGRALIYVERVTEGGSPVRPLISSGPSSSIDSPEALAAMLTAAKFEAPQYDVALAGQDPHVLGVAVKPLTAPAADEEELRSIRSLGRSKSNKTKGFRS